MQLQCWTLFHVLNFPFAAAFYVVLLRPHSIPQSPYGFWGHLSRATTGYALREGLGVGEVRGPLRVSTGCMDTRIAA